MTQEFSSKVASSATTRVEAMRSSEDVSAMVSLHGRGWGSRQIAEELGCARNTVRHYLREGGCVSYKQPDRRTAFDGLDDWLRERFFRHNGNADVIRQELASDMPLL